MLKNKHLLVSFFCFVTLAISAQNPEKPRLITGPVLGAVSATTARVWFAYKGDGQNLVSLQDMNDNTFYRATRFEKINDKKGRFALTVDFTNLQPGHTYKVVYAVDPLQPYTKCIFRTLDAEEVCDVNFLVGSCAYMSPGFARIAFPGPSVRIFSSMKRKDSDFMVWLGDNVYYMGKDYKSYDNMFDRQLKLRENFYTLRDFLNHQPNYAIWDDHDYGWNDADKNFPLKEDALKVYKGFWPNNYQDSVGGNYFSFRQYDAEFFMTDNRWFLDPEGDTTGAYLGKEQLAWLIDGLKNSTATFKFICTGSQVISDSWYDDSYAKYPVERNQLLDFVAENNIPGVIFLTGDKHFTELSKREWKGYPFYDFTCSPLTSPILNTKYLKAFQNTYSIKSTILYKKNFGRITLQGYGENRTCLIEAFKLGGKKKWAYSIPAAELKRK